MTPVAASVAAPHVIDGRLRLLMLYLERRDQGVLCRHSHGSPLAGDVNPNCEFERHVLIPSMAIFASRTRVDGVVTRTIARIRLVGKMAHDDLVCPPSVCTRDHPARRLALCAFHPQLPR